MQLIGAKVRNRYLGEGTVERLEKDRIYIRFAQHLVEVGFPAVFAGSYTIDDAQTRDYVACCVQKEKEARQAQFSAQRVKSREETRSRLDLRSNVAFKCNWCDGGRSAKRVGFCGICSDRVMTYNVSKARRPWCVNSPCADFVRGELDWTELAAIHEEGFICYESVMLRDWQAFAGADQTEQRKGRRRGLKQARTGSLAVLTGRRPNRSEEERIIFAVFLIGESFEGDERDEGGVAAHEKYRLELTPPQAEQMLFWHYHRNENTSDRAFWGTGLFRYLDDAECARILRDIAMLKAGEPDGALAREMFGYYCTLRNLDPDRLSGPDGPLG